MNTAAIWLLQRISASYQSSSVLLRKMSKQIILFTGATGHLGFRTLVIALEAGYRARVVLRRLEQAEKIKHARSIKPHSDSMGYVQVPDIRAATAYDEAIKGVDYVLYIASPIYSAFTPEEASRAPSKHVRCAPC